MGSAGLTDIQRRPFDAVPALTNFLNQRSIQDARTRNRSKLSPEELQALSDKLNSSGRMKPMDTDATKSNICGIKIKEELKKLLYIPTTPNNLKREI
jgi:hypothetical protein